MMEQGWKKETIADVINLALGAWLFLTPWIFGFASEAAPSWTAWLSGIAIAAVAIAVLVAFTEWEEWVDTVEKLAERDTCLTLYRHATVYYYNKIRLARFG
jgi:SPW repeat